MSDIEERLRTALAARAELVRHEDLALDPVLRQAAPAPARWRRPAAVLLVAATVAIAAAVPVVLLARGDDDEPPVVDDPTTAPTTATTSAPPPSTHWWEQHPDGLPQTWGGTDGNPRSWREGDVDADGSTDQVRISGSEGFVDLQVELGDGRSLTTPLAGPTAALQPLATLDGGAGAVIPVAVSEGAAGTTYTTWHVYLVRDGEIVEATVAGGELGPVLGSQVSNLTEAEGGHDTWRTWVDASVGIVTMSYDDQGTPVTDPGFPGAAATVYRNTFYRWTLDGTTLVASHLGQGCTVRDDDAVTACPPN